MSNTVGAKDEGLAAIVEGGADGQRRRRTRLWLAAGLAFLLLAGYCVARSRGGSKAARFRTEPVTRGELIVKITATGKLQPLNQVDVGSEVSGLVESVFVDDNDYVKKGQVLARLDVSKLQDAVVNARAALTSAEAGVLQSEANVREAQANLSRLRQVAELSGGKVPSKAELETGEAALARSLANQAGAGAAVEQARASLRSAETNLAKASIRSPIDGVVLSRAVEPGQTVAASFQVATLFTLAEDLKQMELEVDVAEADVGQVREGQLATFSVDAQGNRKYEARVRRVSYGSQTTSGVVSYKTIMTVNNDDITLRPGMTATAEITTIEHKDVLLAPNAALRFTPSVTAAPERQRSVVSRLLPQPPRFTSRANARNGKNGKNGAGQVFVLDNGAPVAVPV
ncbi:MAG: efflux RND transporter periplasmic adaptor subunit, partial [Vicinamibacteria bacterium]|nr:efflux RND transporter periplasmic adaptor subunit [Vicinamibacteria bacterium]